MKYLLICQQHILIPTPVIPPNIQHDSCAAVGNTLHTECEVSCTERTFEHTRLFGVHGICNSLLHILPDLFTPHIYSVMQAQGQVRARIS